jgi:hypothetical protein
MSPALVKAGRVLLLVMLDFLKHCACYVNVESVGHAQAVDKHVSEFLSNLRSLDRVVFEFLALFWPSPLENLKKFSRFYADRFSHVLWIVIFFPISLLNEIGNDFF